jgi:hypothetical protein
MRKIMSRAFAVINTFRGGTVLEAIFSTEEDAVKFVEGCEHNRFLEIDEYDTSKGKWVHTVKKSLRNS